jgi:hypothetical protein
MNFIAPLLLALIPVALVLLCDRSRSSANFPFLLLAPFLFCSSSASPVRSCPS